MGMCSTHLSPQRPFLAIREAFHLAQRVRLRVLGWKVTVFMMENYASFCVFGSASLFRLLHSN